MRDEKMAQWGIRAMGQPPSAGATRAGNAGPSSSGARQEAEFSA